MPDPTKLFVIEVDASEVGVGAVLLQCHGNPEKLYPCAFFSQKLTPAEINYDIGNRELLAVKTAIEEWRHWLEGALHPFTVLTDHPRQACWALLFTWFHFTISYRLRSKNAKANILSRQYMPSEQIKTPESIIHPSMVLAPITWDLDADIACEMRG